MFLLPMFVLTSAVAPPPAAKAVAPPSTERARQTIGAAWCFWRRSGAGWWKGNKCASCHHVPISVWSLTEAKNLGFAVNDKSLGELRDSALASYVKHPKFAARRPGRRRQGIEPEHRLSVSGRDVRRGSRREGGRGNQEIHGPLDRLAGCGRRVEIGGEIAPGGRRHRGTHHAGPSGSFVGDTEGPGRSRLDHVPRQGAGVVEEGSTERPPPVAGSPGAPRPPFRQGGRGCAAGTAPARSSRTATAVGGRRRTVPATRWPPDSRCSPWRMQESTPISPRSAEPGRS